jgi:hypothetical protein
MFFIIVITSETGSAGALARIEREARTMARDYCEFKTSTSVIWGKTPVLPEINAAIVFEVTATARNVVQLSQQHQTGRRD